MLIFLYLVLFLLGFHLDWVANPYDESRLLQIILAVVLVFFYLFKKEKKEVTLDKALLFFFILIALWYAVGNWFQVVDLILWLNLGLLFFILKKFDFHSEVTRNSLILLIIFALFIHFFIPLVFYDFIVNGKLYSWQMNSSSIRILNSVIIPIFWLSCFFKRKNKYINILYPFICYFFGLGLLVDGARSALLSLIVPLVLLFILNQEYRKEVFKTFIWLFFAFITYQSVYYIYNLIHGTDRSLNIARYSSSYRAEMWIFMFEEWKKNPLLGTGGGYLAQIQYQYGHHIHNVYLRLVFEWGILGIIALVWLGYHFMRLLKSSVDVVLKMGVLSIAIDAMFSGNFIYPVSQVICVLFIALTFSQMKTQVATNSKYVIKEKYLFLPIFILYCLLVVTHLGSDIICVGCGSAEGRAAPFFWEHGGSTKLERVE